jgi:sensor histidine kinase regulating citrate/malate metabolism
MIGSIGAIVVGCLQGYLLGEGTYITNRVLMYAILCLCLLTIGICIYFIVLLNSRNYYKQMDTLNKAYQHEQETYYRTVDDMNLKLRKFRHDYNSHMNSIRYLCEGKQYEELNTYLQNLEVVKEELSIAYQSGNSIINAVMNSISKKANEKDIEINFKGYLPSDLNITSVDLCTLFSNAMQNAYEACELIPADRKKYINVELTNNKDRLYIAIENPVNQPVIIAKGAIVSKKSDIENHGFGIINMKSVADKYHGSICWSNQEGGIRTEISLTGVVRNQI